MTGPRPVSPDDPQRGFTLLEVLVAFVILALSIGVIMTVFSSSLARGKESETRTVAALLAQSKLAAVGIEEPLSPGVREGRFDDTFAWRAAVEPYSDGLMADLPGGLIAYRVTVTVSWRARNAWRQVSLATLRLAAPE